MTIYICASGSSAYSAGTSQVPLRPMASGPASGCVECVGWLGFGGLVVGWGAWWVCDKFGRRLAGPSASLSPGSRLFSILSRHLAGPSVASGCVECVGCHQGSWWVCDKFGWGAWWVCDKFGRRLAGPSASLSPGSRLFSIFSRHLAGPSGLRVCRRCRVVGVWGS